MSNVVNRTTKQYLRSVNTPDFPVIDWIINPDLSAVVGFDSKYWNITGDVVSLMSQAERDAVDAAEVAAIISAERATAAAAPDSPSGQSIGSIIDGIQLRELFEVFNRRDNYIINRLAEIQTQLVQIREQTFGSQARQNIDAGFPLATNTRTRAQAIQDYQDDINAGGAD